MKKTLLFISIGIIVLLLSACSPTTCPPDSLVEPILQWPGMWESITTLSPTLNWAYIGTTLLYPYEYSLCVPESYEVELRTGPFFTDDLGGTTTSPSFTPGSALEPGTEYAWAVAAVSGGSTGDYAGYSYFFTGPTCETVELIAPTLLQPPDGSSVGEASPSLIWDYPDPCIPEGYRVDLSTDLSFLDTSLSGGTGNPSTRWGPGEDLEDCQWYYWRIAPINGYTLGPYSTTFSFYVDLTGTCMPHLPRFRFTPWGPLLRIPRFTRTPTTVPPFLTLLVDSNCRYGPGTFFDNASSRPAGEVLPAIGRNQDGSWFQTRLPNGVLCYLSRVNFRFDGSDDQIPVKPDPPTPTLVPTSTSTPTIQRCQDYPNQNMCLADPQKFGNCWWDTKLNKCQTRSP